MATIIRCENLYWRAQPGTSTRFVLSFPKACSADFRHLYAITDARSGTGNKTVRPLSQRADASGIQITGSLLHFAVDRSGV